MFGGIVSQEVGRFWKEDNLNTLRSSDPGAFIELNDPRSIKVAANFLILPHEMGTCPITETRVLAIRPHGRLKFAPYWYAMRVGGGAVRKVWLDGIRR